jgi:hypothetical protein
LCYPQKVISYPYDARYLKCNAFKQTVTAKGAG